VINVQTFPYHQFPKIYKWQVLSFMKMEWPFIFSGQYQFSEDTYPPEQDPIHFVISQGDALISHAEIIKMKLDHAGTDYLVYGLGNVFTFPPYRGNGYGKEAVKAGTSYIAKSDADVAILFCDPGLKSFYEKAGWAGLPQASTRIGTPKESEENDGLRMMLLLSERGKAGYASFVNQPLYIDDPW
jgi:predicted N-acetyltransferase YhbS